jgi:hypothetical protein
MTATGSPIPVRVAAAEIVDTVAQRLADPAGVTARIAAPQRGWAPLSLAEGLPSVALLFAELGHTDARYRHVAHRYLADAAAAMTAAPPAGLYFGPGALAFAASCAVQRAAEYAGVRGARARPIVDGVSDRLRSEWERMRAGRPGTDFTAYDTITGLAGIGRYLLRRGQRVRASLVDILMYLTALARPLADLPGWWVAHAADEFDDRSEGHANLGLAHGLPGPLALLALAWRSGVRVPDQDRAMTRMTEWLLDLRGADEFGPYWPSTVSRAGLRARPRRPAPARAAWCYGTPGVARALQLAGLALDRPDWTATAVEAVEAMLSRPEHAYGVSDAGLCHGWAGVLHLTRRIGADAAAPWTIEAAERLARRVVTSFDPRAPFGFRAHRPDPAQPADLAGFLEGTAGVALALHAYLRDEPPASGWDAALLAA